MGEDKVRRQPQKDSDASSRDEQARSPRHWVCLPGIVNRRIVSLGYGKGAA